MKPQIFFVLLVSTAVIKAQQLGVSTAKVWTNNYEIQNPVGAGIFYLQPMGKTEIKLEFSYAANERNYSGRMGNIFLYPPSSLENIQSKSSLTSIEAAVWFPEVIALLHVIDFNAAVGIGYDILSGERKELSSGHKVNLNKEDKFGFFYSLSLSKSRMFELPVKLELAFKHKFMQSGAFATDIEQPFTSSVEAKLLQLNVSYIF